MITNVARRLTAAEKAREPRDMGIVAWFDGYSQGAYPGARPMDHPRRLTREEAEFWREGFAEGYRERVCLSWHGFYPCADADPHPPYPKPTDQREDLR